MSPRSRGIKGEKLVLFIPFWERRVIYSLVFRSERGLGQMEIQFSG